MESVVCAHEILHEVKKSNKPGLVLKLDYEKAYDRVSWEFIEEMLKSRGFGPIWVRMVMSALTDSSFQIQINNSTGHHFVDGKGLKQGDPLSPSV